MLVIGRQAGMWPANLPETETGVEYVLDTSTDEIRAALPDNDVVFHYGHPRDALSAIWDLAERLR